MNLVFFRDPTLSDTLGFCSEITFEAPSKADQADLRRLSMHSGFVSSNHGQGQVTVDCISHFNSRLTVG